MPEIKTHSKRRFERFPLTVPVDISVLRSGVPDTIPGRATNLCEGGLSVVLAAELQQTQTVGVEFRLADHAFPIRTKAMVRHHEVLQCGLEFLGLSEQQLNNIRIWSDNLTDSSRGQSADSKEGTSKLWQPKVSTWKWAIFVLLVVLIAGLGWWYWQRGWDQLEIRDHFTATISSSETSVPPATMMALLVHQVDPIYPESARSRNLQGTVVLELEVGQDGSVVHINPISGPELFLQPAIEAVRWWRFQPYRVDDKPVSVKTTVAVKFQP